VARLYEIRSTRYQVVLEARAKKQEIGLESAEIRDKKREAINEIKAAGLKSLVLA
jgi:hypothetical protein